MLMGEGVPDTWSSTTFLYCTFKLYTCLHFTNTKK